MAKNGGCWIWTLAECQSSTKITSYCLSAPGSPPPNTKDGFPPPRAPNRDTLHKSHTEQCDFGQCIQVIQPQGQPSEKPWRITCHKNKDLRIFANHQQRWQNRGITFMKQGLNRVLHPLFVWHGLPLNHLPVIFTMYQKKKFSLPLQLGCVVDAVFRTSTLSTERRHWTAVLINS